MMTTLYKEVSDTYLENHDNQALTSETQGSTLLLTGDIDLYVAAAFREMGEAHVREYDEPVIDLTGVPFLDSAGLASLLSIARAARNHRRTLHVIANGNPRRVLRITGVDQMISMRE